MGRPTIFDDVAFGDYRNLFFLVPPTEESTGSLEVPEEERNQLRKKLDKDRQTIRKATLLFADEPATHFKLLTEKESEFDIAEKYPVCAPSIFNCFIESNVMFNLYNKPTALGIWCIHSEININDLEFYRCEYGMSTAMCEYIKSHNVRWIIQWRTFSREKAQTRIYAFGFYGYAFISDSGLCCGCQFLFADGQRYRPFCSLGHKAPETALGVMLSSFCFMNCKNSTTCPIERHVIYPNGKRNKKTKITYRVIRVGQQITQSLGSVSATMSPRECTALHICRGNFAHYTADKPLFGKYVGTYWRPMHTRGSSKHGQVFKDYEVSACPKNQKEER